MLLFKDSYLPLTKIEITIINLGLRLNFNAKIGYTNASKVVTYRNNSK